MIAVHRISRVKAIHNDGNSWVVLHLSSGGDEVAEVTLYFYCRNSDPETEVEEIRYARALADAINSVPKMGTPRLVGGDVA